jgi:hypothetical protein
VVDAPTWDKALRVGDKLLDHRGQADLPTPPEQTKLCRDVAKKGHDLRSAVREFEGAISNEDFDLFLKPFLIRARLSDTRSRAIISNSGPLSWSTSTTASASASL